MTAPAPTADSFFAGGYKSAKFDVPGKIYQGVIVAVPTVSQQTDFVTRTPKTYDDGSPMYQLAVPIQTDERDPEDPYDDGVRSIYVKGQMTSAIKQALRAAGRPRLEIGGTLIVRYDGDAEPQQRGMNGAKQFTAAYTPPPTMADQLLGAAPAPQAAPLVKAAAPAPAMTAPAQLGSPASVVATLPPPQATPSPGLLPTAVMAAQQSANTPLPAPAPAAMPAAAPAAGGGAGAQFTPEQLAAMQAAGIDISAFSR